MDMLSLVIGAGIGAFLGWLAFAEKPEGFWWKRGDPEEATPIIPPTEQLREILNDPPDTTEPVPTLEAAAEDLISLWVERSEVDVMRFIPVMNRAVNNLQAALDSRELTPGEFEREYREEGSLRLPPFINRGDNPQTYRMEP